MTTAVTRRRGIPRAVDLTLSIILMVVGVVVLVIEGILDVLLLFTSADSPGDIEGATTFSFQLLLAGGIVWAVACVVAIVLMVRGRNAWWVALIGVAAPIGCMVWGFYAVTSVVQ